MENNSQNIFKTLEELLKSHQDFLNKISTEVYSRPILVLGNATIGCHTRHLIEFLQTAISGYDKEIVNYDQRARNKNLENDPHFAVQKISEILENANHSNKKLLLQQNCFGENVQIYTTYFRELLYNIEHCIHHQALIKVAILELKRPDLVDENFGIAFSTIKSKEECAP